MLLKELLKKEYTEFNCELPDWTTCLSYVGSILEKNEVMNHQYTEDMISLVKELGPYIVVTKNIALAHARPNGNVYKNAIALLTLREGVNFGNESNDPVYIVFAIAAKTDSDHLYLFQLLAEYLSEEKNIEIIKQAKKYEELCL